MINNSILNSNVQQQSQLEQLQQKYKELLNNNLSGAPTPPRTVFNDIAEEWNNCTEEERKFIEKDQEYTQANLLYTQQFNAFLLEQFGPQFINSQYGASAEKVLLALKNAKGRCKNAAAEDLIKIKNENKLLQEQIKELEQMIIKSGGGGNKTTPLVIEGLGK